MTSSSVGKMINILPISGKDGDDVPLYLEKQLAKILAEIEKLKEEKDS